MNVILMPRRDTGSNDAEWLRRQAYELLRQADEKESQPAVTVGDVLDSYEREADHLTPHERRNVVALHAHLRKHLGGKLVSALNKIVLQSYAKARQAELTPRKTHPTPMSINAEMKRLKAALGHAQDTQPGFVNPLRKLPLLPVSRKRRLPWGEHELRVLLAHSPADWWSVLCLCRFELGGRPTETVLLEWADVNLERGTITYRDENVKTRRTRTIPMTQRLLATLRDYRKATPGERFLFANPRTGRPYTEGHCWKLWRDTVEESGLDTEGCCSTWHSVRAIASNAAKRRGVDIVERMSILGHCTLAATDVYSDASEEDLREAVRRIEDGAMREARKAPKQLPPIPPRPERKRPKRARPVLRFRRAHKARR